MIVLDANILLYAHVPASPHHAKARPWFEAALSKGEPVGIPWQCVAAFLRVVTNAKLDHRLTIAEAAQIVDRWLEQPNVRLLTPGDNHWPLLRQMLIEGQVRGPMITGAELAALSIECGGVLHTTDRDFARFPGLRWVNPIA